MQLTALRTAADAGDVHKGKLAIKTFILYLLYRTNSGETEYYRKIDPVGADYILEHYKRYGGPKPPSLDHQGIDDSFLEKASVVLYCYEGEWLELSGAD